MLQAGYVFCHRCGNATQDAFYFNASTNAWVQLFRTITGRFVVTKYTPPYQQGKIDPAKAAGIHRFRFSPTNGRQVQGLQHKIRVECHSDKAVQVLDFVRSCPFCVGLKEGWSSAVELLPHLGDLPTFVIGVVGARTVGKSCWIHALSCPSNINVVNDSKNSTYSALGYTLGTSEWSEEQTDIINPNALNERGKTRMMYIRKKSDGSSHAVAQVLVMDFAGELFAENKQNEFESEAAHIFRGGEGYSGVDAVVFMTDPLPEKSDYSLATTYHRARGEYDLLQNKPIAFVMNKVDLLIDAKPQRHINNDPSLAEVPLLTEDTFIRQDSDMYRKSELQARVALQTALLKRIHPLVRAISNETRCAGFLVKSTDPFVAMDPASGKKEDMLNFGKSINVMDPLLWVLNELDIFPIEE